MKPNSDRKYPSRARPSPLFNVEYASLFLALTLAHLAAGLAAALRTSIASYCRLRLAPPQHCARDPLRRPPLFSKANTAYSLPPHARPAVRWLVPPAFPRLLFFSLPLSSRIPAHAPLPRARGPPPLSVDFPSPVLLLLH